MAITWEDLKDYVGADDSDEAQLTEDAVDAEFLVSQYVGDQEVPSNIVKRAELVTGQGLWDQRQARGGFLQEQFPTQEGAAWGPVRVARDPMANAYKVLNGWVVPWI